MRKREVKILLLLLFILVIAFSFKKSSGKEVVYNLLESCIDKDIKRFNKLFRHNKFGATTNTKEIMESLSKKVSEMGGIENIELKEYDMEDIERQAAQEMKDIVEGDFVVVEISGNNKSYIWLIRKENESYYIVSGDDGKINDILAK
ncbi:hypothetical protein CLPU_8c00090 [Gottschalkia purinilytica]|uniref:DUF4878 domain-containing protein n=1 Tax=Gottschalkia purinilytica TaxID=1503 RepID=A0A0L0W9N0_GOTPU|nr:hypothetical protein [Gottschalkia purinilytica]KNF08244.1 hypothetical protein CLPU_8c00090 [Gottschalkia purinilytica]